MSMWEGVAFNLLFVLEEQGVWAEEGGSEKQEVKSREGAGGAAE